MSDAVTRRNFLKVGSAAVALGLAGSALRGQDAAQPLRCGFVGVGGRGTGLLKSVLGFEDVDVVSICDTTPNNLKRGCDLTEEAKGKRPQALGAEPYEYRKLLDPNALDCLVMATPCFWHSRMYVDALEAGMHFYGEKPMAITAKGVKWIQDARAAHSDVVVQIGFQWGGSPARAETIEKVQQGEIGDLVEGRFHRYNGWASLGRWFNDRRLSGDWMLEQAVHEFNLMWWVTQTHPLAAYTVGRSHLIEPDNQERDVTDFYTTILEYPNGLVIHYSHGWIDPPGFGGMSTRFIGTKGGIDVLGCNLRFHGKKEPWKSEAPNGDTREHLRNFFDSVRAGKPDMVNCGIGNGAAASYVGLLIRKSLDEKRRVTFEEMLDDTLDLPPLPAA
jgi:myo-inositol 2-dehydrogenase/D-chiro-inositol 1-dehydrogenase